MRTASANERPRRRRARGESGWETSWRQASGPNSSPRSRRGCEEADRRVVDRERVRLQRPGGVLGADQPRLALQDARPRAPPARRARSRTRAGAARRGPSSDVAGEPGLAESGQQPSAPSAGCGPARWMAPDLRRREDPVLGERGDDLDRRLAAAPGLAAPLIIGRRPPRSDAPERSGRLALPRRGAPSRRLPPPPLLQRREDAVVERRRGGAITSLAVASGRARRRRARRLCRPGRLARRRPRPGSRRARTAR